MSMAWLLSVITWCLLDCSTRMPSSRISAASAAVANFQPKLLQFFGHSWTAVAAQAETELSLDMSEHDHVGLLPTAGRTTVISP